MKRLFAVICSTVLLLSVLTGCGSSAKYDAVEMEMTETPMAAPAEAKMYVDEETGMGFGYSAKAGNAVTTAVSGAAQSADSKMIYRASIEMQTTDFEAGEHAIGELVKSCNGYFENRSLSNYSSDYRYANYTVRVPVAEYEHFCAQVGELCHVVYMASSAENITETYYDTFSRLDTAKIKLNRLQELLEKAETMEDIITIESAISETEWQIENLSGTLRHYDALVDYATVNLSLSEVYKLSGTDSAPVTFGERLWNALKSGVTDAVDFAENLLIRIAGAWVFLLVLIAVMIVLFRCRRRFRGISLCRKSRKSRKNQNLPEQKVEAQEKVEE